VILEKKTLLSPILNSSEGIHLTAYLLNNYELEDLKIQLSAVLSRAREYLAPALDEEQIENFLEPIKSLLNDGRILGNMKGNIGLFRTAESFRVLNIPIDLQTQCHVASSFHVKPLLKWMQVDNDFLILGLNRESLSLYSGNQNNIYKAANVNMPDVFKQSYNTQLSRFKKSTRIIQQEREAFYKWLVQWFAKKTENSNLKVFLVGDKFLVDGFLKYNKYKNIVQIPIAPFFDETQILDIATFVRKILKEDARKILASSLLEFRFAEEENRTRKNIFQIAKAAVQGQIKKLIVADGVNIFGKIDKHTGGLAINPYDMDHEDDDILDDLAQMVLALGGDVVVARPEEIPKGRTVLAILNNEENIQEKKQELIKEQEILREKV
jgi:hypothetical protein